MLRKRYPNGARKTWYSTATFAINGSITVGEAAVFDLRRKEGRRSRSVSSGRNDRACTRYVSRKLIEIGRIKNIIDREDSKFVNLNSIIYFRNHTVKNSFIL